MSLVHALVALLPLLVTGSVNTSLHKIPITCDAGTFAAGHHGSVTCNFHKDMNADRRGINVVRYALDAADNDPGTNALTCGWKKEDHKYLCIAGDGFTFDDSISDRLTVQIPAVRAGYGGLYMCFIVPSEETQKHACELNVKGQEYTTTPKQIVTAPPDHDGKDGPSHLWVIAVPVILLLALVVLFFVWKRMIWDKKQRAEYRNVPSSEVKPCYPPESTRGEKPKSTLKGLQLSEVDCERVFKLLKRELVATFDSTCIKKHTSQHSMPKGTEVGGFLSIGLASDGLDIRHVVLSGPSTEIPSARYSLRTDKQAMQAEAGDNDLMSFFFSVAERVKQFLNANKLGNKAFPAEFVLNTQFGYDQEVTMERLREYTTGKFCEEDMDRDANELLQQALRKINVTRRLRLRPTVKDPVGTLLSGLYHDPGCTAAFLSSVNLSACYVSENSSDEQSKGITTIELGTFGESGVLDVLRTDFDTELDKCSENPKEKILEKMVSVRHLGELLRLALLELIHDRELFLSVPDTSALHKKDALTMNHVSLILSDVNKQNGMAERVLDELNLKNYSPRDCDIVRDACNTIADRSAHLTAAALAALITVLQQRGDKEHPELKAKAELKIAVDGFMCRDFPTFQQTVQDTTRKLIKGDPKFKLLPQYHGRRVGAAVAACSEVKTRASETLLGTCATTTAVFQQNKTKKKVMVS